MFDTAQTSLSAASFLPVIGDAIDLSNAGISYLRGNYGDVTTYAAASWIPFVAGAVIKKGADTLGDVTKKADEVADVGKDITGTSIPSKLPTNAGNLKTLSKEWLKEKGIDAHELKRDILGQKLKEISKYNIAVNESGLIVLVPIQRGNLPNVDTGISISSYLE